MTQALGVFSVLLFFGSVLVSALLFRQKRWGWFCLSLGMSASCYALEQYLADLLLSGWRAQGGFAFVPLPPFAAAACALLTAALVFSLFRISLYEKSRVTPMSIKEAMDSLPAGMLCFAPGGQILMCNAAMSRLCRAVTGSVPINGEALREALFSGPLPPGCSRIPFGEEAVYALPDGSAWKISAYPLVFEKRQVHMLLSLDVSETYRQTQKLERMRADLAALEERLKAVNREIVALTAQRELLNTRVKIHDELGSNLLAIKRHLALGGGQEERAQLIERLCLNLSFLQAGPEKSASDEYELLLQTARNLGLRLDISGPLPGEGPVKRILTTAIHECITNTLRHAHGDALRVEISQNGQKLTAVFTNSGQAPTEPIQEKGGLSSLRQMVEDAGGSMRVGISPSFSLTLELDA